MKILNSTWFGGIGIVKIFNGFENKFYIGNGIGIDENADAKSIAEHGTPLIPEYVISFLSEPGMIPAKTWKDILDKILSITSDGSADERTEVELQKQLLEIHRIAVKAKKEIADTAAKTNVSGL